MKSLILGLLVAVVLMSGCARIGPIVQDVSYDEKTNELVILSNTYVVPIGILGDLFYFPGAHWEGPYKTERIKLQPSVKSLDMRSSDLEL